MGVDTIQQSTATNQPQNETERTMANEINKIETEPARQFTKDDWWGWMGCEHFKNGDEPVLRYGERDRGDAGEESFTVVIDKNGVGFYQLDCEGNDTNWFIPIEFPNAAAALLFANAIDFSANPEIYGAERI